MPRNRVPTSILDARGAFLQNPSRTRSDEPTSNRPLGKPPKWMSKAEKATWKELASQVLPGVVFASDRLMFALMVRLATMLCCNQPMSGVEMGTLVSLGSRFALTPADRSKVTVEKPRESSLDAFIKKQVVTLAQETKEDVPQEVVN